MLHHYELVLLVHPDGENPGERQVKSISDLVAKSDGAMTRTEDVGRRTLAYEIGGMRKAAYHVLNFSLPTLEAAKQVMEQLEELIRFDETIMRHLLVRTDSQPQGESPLKTAKNIALTGDEDTDIRSARGEAAADLQQKAGGEGDQEEDRIDQDLAENSAVADDDDGEADQQIENQGEEAQVTDPAENVETNKGNDSQQVKPDSEQEHNEETSNAK